jgi:hypothetical protein
MGKGSSSSKGSSKGSADYGRGVSTARLSQKSGTAFGGYAKVQTPSGDFKMKPTGK